MNTLIYVAVLLIVFGLLSFLLLLLVIVVDSVVRGHDLPTSRRVTKSIVKIIFEYRAARNFYDLGCAYGALAIRVKRKFPTLSVHAIDNNPIRITLAKIRALGGRRNIQFVHRNIFDVNLNDADIVYSYLSYDLMPLLENKLQKELKRGAIVITNTSHFSTWKPIQKIVTYPKISKMPDFETLFVYQKM